MVFCILLCGNTFFPDLNVHMMIKTLKDELIIRLWVISKLDLTL